MRALLQEESRTPRVGARVLVWGDAGVGKDALAAEVVRRTWREDDSACRALHTAFEQLTLQAWLQMCVSISLYLRPRSSTRLRAHR